MVFYRWKGFIKWRFHYYSWLEEEESYNNRYHIKRWQQEIPLVIEEFFCGSDRQSLTNTRLFLIFPSHAVITWKSRHLLFNFCYITNHVCSKKIKINYWKCVYKPVQRNKNKAKGTQERDQRRGRALTPSTTVFPIFGRFLGSHNIWESINHP